ncbi:MAG TPA: peptidoglycan-binding domain-containing protein [Syntrophomonadaceae bacterium]|nr:peptidoglycan-binding domain-containing protein [Syntrophomonadaceae bacterium]
MKRLGQAGVFVLGIFLLSGCTGSSSGTAVSDKGSKPMEGWQKVVSEAKKPTQDDSLTELEHWKNGVRPGQDISSKAQATEPGSEPSADTKGSSTTNPGDYSSLIIGKLSSIDLDYIMTELVQLGYLKEKGASEQGLREAIIQLQTDNHLTVTGKLDQATLNLLGVKD